MGLNGTDKGPDGQHRRASTAGMRGATSSSDARCDVGERQRCDGLATGWRRVGDGLALGWRWVGAGLALGWRWVGAGLALSWRRIGGQGDDRVAGTAPRAGVRCRLGYPPLLNICEHPRERQTVDTPSTEKHLIDRKNKPAAPTALSPTHRQQPAPNTQRNEPLRQPSSSLCSTWNITERMQSPSADRAQRSTEMTTQSITMTCLIDSPRAKRSSAELRSSNPIVLLSNWSTGRRPARNIATNRGTSRLGTQEPI